MEYDGCNRLVSAWSQKKNCEYRYKPGGLRFAKSVDGKATFHIWDGANMVLEAVGTSTSARYIRGLGLIAREQDSKRQYYLFNAHGDVVQRIDQWGNVLKTYEYDAFGNETNLDKWDNNPFRYCGEYYDSELKTIYLRARNYNAATGRFLTEDPAGDGANWYAYCANEPVGFVDPSGMERGTATMYENGSPKYTVDLLTGTKYPFGTSMGQMASYGGGGSSGSSIPDGIYKFSSANGGGATWTAATGWVATNGAQTFGDVGSGGYNASMSYWSSDEVRAAFSMTRTDSPANAMYDTMGMLILYWWLYGEGKDRMIEGWDIVLDKNTGFTVEDYMMASPKLTQSVRDEVLSMGLNVKKGSYISVDKTFHMEFETGEYANGYNFLHGSNEKVGDFRILGTIRKNIRGDTTYDLAYIWNDIIDTNAQYLSDQLKSIYAHGFIPGATPTDYYISIVWDDKTVIKKNPSPANPSTGWLS